ncbi:MAG: type II/IV secretion system protein [Opitutales bacterium]|jgi:type II secretory ATPase GspE/PulE/Tfp pilus assembly ATPase PilB-like protein|nr:type II/IV secretion system protein [Opitutales bacterium]MBT5815187.1 type II/IV secretion system protein [Opitutales bacterium]MBT6768224.1 type II/IV secretion system protein [Opitutales bacterium]MBT7865774.1 type II/IV secretion system protein [Opitutales bacterium]
MALAEIDFLDTFELSNEQRLEIEGLRRSERLERLANWANKDLSEVVGILSESQGVEVVSHEAFDLDRLNSIPLRILHEFHCIPVKEASESENASETLVLATGWPVDEVMDDWVYATCGRRPEWRFANPDRISKFITQNLGVGAESLDESFDIDEDLVGAIEEDEEDEDAAIIRFVNEVFSQAVDDGATDIHFEPMEEELRIRYRIDGLLVSVPVPDNLRKFQDAIVSRLKIMAKLNISERRLPQDGRITMKAGDTTLDIRLSTMPVMYGESISLRLLNKKSSPLSMQQLGMSDLDQEKVDRVLGLPYGIVLVTGPTGSGKSTSLNAFIRKINSEDRRIITVEDPIEYEVPGVNQIQVKQDIGFGFAEALRHVLRQDPNVIMVGEIRDKETADIAIQASLTGHLVFSTLHTNDSAGAITRLTDMGIEPFLIASGVELVIAQRLLRRLCQECYEMKLIDRSAVTDSLKILDLPESSVGSVAELPVVVGCERCRNIGYKGRVGIYEILRVTEALHSPIVNREAAPFLREIGRQGGMVTLGESGWNLACQNMTTLDEVVRTISIKEASD